MNKKYISFLIIAVLILSAHSTLGLIINKEEVNPYNYEKPCADIISMIEEVNYSLLFGYLEKIVSFGIRHTGSENNRLTAEYVNEEFQNLGLDSYIDPWSYLRYSCQNVVATYNGTDSSSDAVFVLTAHIDTLGESVGANDDGSGVAALLTIANIFSKYSFNHTIKFVVVSGHELGTYGSFDYAKKACRRNENIITNINVDMIGNSTCGHISPIWTPQRSYSFYYFCEDVNEKYYNYIDMKVQLHAHYPMDSQSFVDYGYDGISFIQPKIFDYPIHTPDDSLENINYPYYENMTKLILAITVELANKEIVVQVRIDAPKEGCIYLFNIPLLKLPGFNIHQTNLRGMTYLIGRSNVKINITTDEEIITVAYIVDGNTDYLSLINEPPYDWKIQKPGMKILRLRGKHKLGVHVYTNTGKTAYDEMDFFALTRI